MSFDKNNGSIRIYLDFRMQSPVREKLENGLSVITDRLKGHHSVSIKLWVKAGSRFENKNNNGVAHFLEHMAFKGTKTKSAYQIAKEFDELGGNFNACTGRESTIYYVKVLSEFAEKGIEILSDIILNSIFEQQEIIREKSVILEEIAQTEDAPDDVIFDRFFENIYPDQSFGRSILGTKENIKNLSEIDLKNFMQDYYFADNMMLIVSGAIDHSKVMDYARKYLSDLDKSQKKIAKEKPSYFCGNFRQSKSLEQTHVIFGFSSFCYLDNLKKVYAEKILSKILGSSMSSRLFQEVREKRGLAYAISSFYAPSSDSGVFGIYSSTDAKNLPEFVKVVFDEINKLDTITEDEIYRAKKQIRASVLMQMENNESRAGYIGNCFQYFDKYITEEEIMEIVDSINMNDVHLAVDKTFFGKNLSVAVIGDVSKLPECSNLLENLND